VIATGGALGGVFASLVAPMVFNSVAEYPIAIVLALLAREGLRRDGARRARFGRRRAAASAADAGPGDRSARAEKLDNVSGASPRQRARALLIDTAFAIALLILAGIGARLGGPAWVGLAIGAGIPAVLLYLSIASPRRFALGAAALLAAQMLLPEPDSRTVLVQRTFFGVHRVLVGPDPDRDNGLLVRLRHGTTPHGMQRVEAPGRPDPTPLLYYHPRGPLGQLFGELSACADARADGRADGRAQRVGLIGLGVGAAAAYAREGARWTFYEIDAEVVRIAR